MIQNYSQFNIYNLSKIYYRQKEFKKAEIYATKALSIKPNTNIAIYYANMLYDDTNQTSKAIRFLDDYIQDNTPSYDLYVVIAGLYIKNKDTANTINTVKNIYLLLQKDNLTYKHIDTFAVRLLRYMDKSQKLSLINFLETHDMENDMLLALYLDTSSFTKAQILTKNLYEETSKIGYYAQNTMLQYEVAKNKSYVLDEVIDEFNYIISKNKNSRYLNFLGYILIDHDIDIKRGVKLVELALKKSPDNIAYKDSLAWGYYKLGQCNKAKVVMTNIFLTKDIKDETILAHNKLIRNCR